MFLFDWRFLSPVAAAMSGGSAPPPSADRVVQDGDPVINGSGNQVVFTPPE